MLERVLDVGNGGPLVDELRKLQMVEHPLQVLLSSGQSVTGDAGIAAHVSSPERRSARHLAHQSQRKFSADHSESLEQLLLLPRQPVDTRRQHVLHNRWQAHLAHRFCQLYRAVAREHSLVKQRFPDLLHEEWIAFSTIDDETFERQKIQAVSEQGRKHLLSALLTQRVEAKLGVVGLATP